MFNFQFRNPRFCKETHVCPIWRNSNKILTETLLENNKMADTLDRHCNHYLKSSQRAEGSCGESQEIEVLIKSEHEKEQKETTWGWEVKLWKWTVDIRVKGSSKGRQDYRDWTTDVEQRTKGNRTEPEAPKAAIRQTKGHIVGPWKEKSKRKD